MRRALLLLALVVGSACAGSDDDATSTEPAATSATTAATTSPTTAPRPTTSTVPVAGSATSTTTSTTTAPTTSASTSSSSSSTSTSTSTSTTVPASTTTMAGVPGLATDAIQYVEFGRSVEGRPLYATERGTPGGAVVLVIGVIHGNEADGVAIVERLATLPVPDGVDLWLVESINPDGQAVPQRGNAHQVDLNRNFPYDWGPIGEPGDGQYAGPGPASEPETQALVGLVNLIQPDLTLWYHQDLYRLSPGEGFEGELKARYGELTGLPIEDITGGTYTGVAATWVRRTLEAPSFIVELGGDLPPADADLHAAAVLDLAALVAARVGE